MSKHGTTYIMANILKSRASLNSRK